MIMMFATRNHLQSLPEEILLHILSFLEPRQLADLQSVSKAFLRICRDGSVWRNRCLSAHAQKKLVRLGLLDEDTDATTTPNDDSALPEGLSSWRLAGRSSLYSSKETRKEHLRLLANWDPAFPNEKANWYQEYIHRHAPISVSWFQRPSLTDGSHGAFRDVRGCALYRSSSTDHQLRAVAPLDDGSICLWNVNGTDGGTKGGILAESARGLLYSSKTTTTHSRKEMGVDPVECVSVDSLRDRAYFAIKNRLVEVDLGTLKVVEEHAFEWGIHTLSSIQPSIPLTVGTHLGIHLFDHRSPTMPSYAALAQPGPISINHMEKPGNRLDVTDDIFVAGRFSSILHYDRRMFPTIKGSIHSGANICSLASLPYPFSCVTSELRRNFQLSEEEVGRAKTQKGTTLVACGEYKTKGSLELYGISEPQSPGGTPIVRTFQTSTLKNRQTASSAKLLSVVNHGTRLVYSDGQGCIKWMERDGFTEVRNHKLGNSEKFEHHSLFKSMPGSDEMALKLLSTQTDLGDLDGINDDILFWTGEKLGLLSFSSKPGSYADDFETNSKTPEELEQQEEENSYRDGMREALRQQALNAHFVQNLGAGLGGGI